ncbi:unnamed protein product [Leptosia nina]|uniref:Uncharacterized protein n=1 Tax=Leptosia nina TaxID=320188 RepID=A0AAV1JHA6_9NEOP
MLSNIPILFVTQTFLLKGILAQFQPFGAARNLADLSHRNLAGQNRPWIPPCISLNQGTPYNAMPENSISFPSAPGNSFPFTTIPANSMAINPSHSLPFTGISGNAMLPLPIHRLSLPQMINSGHSINQPLLQNINPFHYRSNVYDSNMMNLNPWFPRTVNFYGPLLNTYQVLTLNNLLGNIPYSSIGFIDEQTHLAGFTIPSTLTIIKNPHINDLSMNDNRSGILNNLPIPRSSVLDFISNVRQDPWMSRM